MSAAQVRHSPAAHAACIRSSPEPNQPSSAPDKPGRHCPSCAKKHNHGPPQGLSRAWIISTVHAVHLDTCPSVRAHFMIARAIILLPAALLCLVTLTPARLVAQEAAMADAPAATASACSPGFHFNQWRRCVPNRTINDATRDAFDPRRMASSASIGQSSDHRRNIDVCPPSQRPNHAGQCVPKS